MCYFFFNDTATTEIYTLSLHDALPISRHALDPAPDGALHVARGDGLGGEMDSLLARPAHAVYGDGRDREDRKSTRLNSSHANISYAVFCLKKKNNHL